MKSPPLNPPITLGGCCGCGKSPCPGPWVKSFDSDYIELANGGQIPQEVVERDAFTWVANPDPGIRGGWKYPMVEILTGPWYIHLSAQYHTPWYLYPGIWTLNFTAQPIAFSAPPDHFPSPDIEWWYWTNGPGLWNSWMFPDGVDWDQPTGLDGAGDGTDVTAKAIAIPGFVPYSGLDGTDVCDQRFTISMRRTRYYCLWSWKLRVTGVLAVPFEQVTPDMLVRTDRVEPVTSKYILSPPP